MKKKKLRLFVTAEEYLILGYVLEQASKDAIGSEREDLARIYDGLSLKIDRQIFLQGGFVK